MRAEVVKRRQLRVLEASSVQPSVICHQSFLRPGRLSVSRPQPPDGDGAAEADVLAAVEVGLAGDELAGGLGVEIGVVGAAGDPPHRPGGVEGLVGAGGDASLRTPADSSPRARGGGRCTATTCRRPPFGRRACPKACRTTYVIAWPQLVAGNFRRQQCEARIIAQQQRTVRPAAAPCQRGTLQPRQPDGAPRVRMRSPASTGAR